ncbi:hypothetical protein D3C86_1910340 [compost metagenome]
MDIVFTGPLHLHRLAGGLGQYRRLDDEVRLGLAPETAAEQRDIHRHLLEAQAQPLGDPLAGHLRRLGRRPDLATAVVQVGNGDHRLHR